jgi:multidrug efflux pump subunit AcrB
MNGNVRGSWRRRCLSGAEKGATHMLAVIAAILFVIAFIIYAAAIATTAIFAPESLALVGLALLALHLTGRGPEVPSGWGRSRGRR